MQASIINYTILCYPFERVNSMHCIIVLRAYNVLYQHIINIYSLTYKAYISASQEIINKNRKQLEVVISIKHQIWQ